MYTHFKICIIYFVIVPLSGCVKVLNLPYRRTVVSSVLQSAMAFLLSVNLPRNISHLETLVNPLFTIKGEKASFSPDSLLSLTHAASRTRQVAPQSLTQPKLLFTLLAHNYFQATYITQSPNRTLLIFLNLSHLAHTSSILPF